MNETTTFEKFLENRFDLISEGILDDDLEDAYNDWVSNLDVQEIMEYAELYGKQQFIRGQEKIINSVGMSY